jgi:MerR family mercuric resistance operon transcriptional regulator
MAQARTIGGLAREAGVNVETIRYYERRGILKRPVGGGRGPRHYPEQALTTLQYVKRTQGLGFSLAEIGELLALRSDPDAFCEEGRQVVEQKLEAIERKISELKAIRRELKRGMKACHDSGGGSHCPGIAGLTPSKEKNSS